MVAYTIELFLLILCQINLIQSMVARSATRSLTLQENNQTMKPHYERATNNENVLISLLLKNDKPEHVSLTKTKTDVNNFKLDKTGKIMHENDVFHTMSDVGAFQSFEPKVEFMKQDNVKLNPLKYNNFIEESVKTKDDSLIEPKIMGVHIGEHTNNDNKHLLASTKTDNNDSRILNMFSYETITKERSNNSNLEQSKKFNGNLQHVRSDNPFAKTDKQNRHIELEYILRTQENNTTSFAFETSKNEEISKQCDYTKTDLQEIDLKEEMSNQATANNLQPALNIGLTSNSMTNFPSYSYSKEAQSLTKNNSYPYIDLDKNSAFLKKYQNVSKNVQNVSNISNKSQTVSMVQTENTDLHKFYTTPVYNRISDDSPFFINQSVRTKNIDSVPVNRHSNYLTVNPNKYSYMKNKSEVYCARNDNVRDTNDVMLNGKIEENDTILEQSMPLKPVPNWNFTQKVNDAYKANQKLINSDNTNMIAKAFNKSSCLVTDVFRNTHSNKPETNYKKSADSVIATFYPTSSRYNFNPNRVSNSLERHGDKNQTAFQPSLNKNSNTHDNSFQIPLIKEKDVLENNIDYMQPKCLYPYYLWTSSSETSQQRSQVHPLYSSHNLPLVTNNSHNPSMYTESSPKISTLHTNQIARAIDSDKFSKPRTNICDNKHTSIQPSNCPEFKGTVDFIKPLAISNFLPKDQSLPLKSSEIKSQQINTEYTLPQTYCDIPERVKSSHEPHIEYTGPITSSLKYVSKSYNDNYSNTSSNSLDKLVPVLTSNLASNLVANSFTKKSDPISPFPKVPINTYTQTLNKLVDDVTPSVINPINLLTTAYYETNFTNDYPTNYADYVCRNTIPIITPKKLVESVIPPVLKPLISPGINIDFGISTIKSSPKKSAPIINPYSIVSGCCKNDSISIRSDYTGISPSMSLLDSAPYIMHADNLSLPYSNTVSNIKISEFHNSQENNTDSLVPYIASITVNVMPTKEPQNRIIIIV